MQKAVLAIAALAALAAPSVARAGDVSMHVREIPLGARSLTAMQPSQHFNMLAVHWIGTGTVALSHAQAARRLAAPGATRMPTTGPVPGTTGTSTGPARRAACSSASTGRSQRLRRTRSGRASPARPPRALAGRHAGDRDAGSVGRERGDRACAAVGRTRGAARRHPPHRRHELVHACASRRDRARDRGLPRAGKRLERHRLQLSRRPLRHGVRRPRRRRSSAT